MPLIQKSDSTKIPSPNDGEYVQFGIDSLTDQKSFQQHIFVLTTFFVQDFGAGMRAFRGLCQFNQRLITLSKHPGKWIDNCIIVCPQLLMGLVHFSPAFNIATYSNLSKLFSLGKAPLVYALAFHFY